MGLFEFYKNHSIFSDPETNADFLNSFSDDPAQIRLQVQTLLLHEADAEYYQIKLTSEQYSELNARYISNIISNIKKYSAQPFGRAIVVCRDFALLFCSILRHKNIPCRLRSGFNGYFIPGLYLGAFLPEYFDKSTNQWKIVDPRTSIEYITRYNLKIDFDLTHVPANKFMPAATAWKLTREKKLDESRFGVRQLRGFKILRNHLIQDLALLNKHETLVWDLWGLMLDSPEKNLIILDNLADLLISQKNNILKTQAFYNQYDFLQVPDMVLVDNPYLTERWERLKSAKS